MLDRSLDVESKEEARNMVISPDATVFDALQLIGPRRTLESRNWSRDMVGRSASCRSAYTRKVLEPGFPIWLWYFDPSE